MTYKLNLYSSLLLTQKLNSSTSLLLQKAFIVTTQFQEQWYLKTVECWWLSTISYNETPSKTTSNKIQHKQCSSLNIHLLSQSSAHHEEQPVEQPPCCRGLPLGPSGQWAALPTQPASPGRWHDGSRSGVWLYNLTKLEKISVTELNRSLIFSVRPPPVCTWW